MKDLARWYLEEANPVEAVYFGGVLIPIIFTTIVLFIGLLIYLAESL